MKRSRSTEELAESWTLTPQERLLLFTKTGPSCLGFAVLLKFFQAEGRFPYYPQEVPHTTIQHVAKQAGIDPADWWRYDWKGRTIKNHRAEIRGLLGFREATAADGEAMMLWLQQHYINNDRRPEQVKAAALARFRELRLDPPTPDRVDRLVRSAIASHEEVLCARVVNRLTPDSRARLQNLLQPISEVDAEKSAEQESDNEESSKEESNNPEGQPSRAPLHQLRSEPGKACLNTIEEELAKLELVRSIALPADLFAETPAKLLQSYRQRVAVEELFEIRRHPDPLRLTLLAAY